MTSGMIDWLDLHLANVLMKPVDEAFQGKRLVNWFADLSRGSAKLGAAGKIASAADARWLLEQDVDFAVIGRAAVLHHDLPKKIATDRDFRAIALPVTTAYLEGEGLGPVFIRYMRKYDFVSD
jgi:2,4-dienoyl-CoA reductase-like NADH-dependent reductase (Old Yellow Enzyme family)